jgi:putative FmdB family regulatory protein
MNTVSTSARQGHHRRRRACLDTPRSAHVLFEFVPTYEYECLKCGRVFEEKQRISAAPLTTCDKCGGTVRRLLSAAPFILKGEGWYVTDYPSEARKKARESEKGADKKPAAETSSGDKAPADKSSGEKSSTAASSSATPSAAPSD